LSGTQFATLKGAGINDPECSERGIFYDLQEHMDKSRHQIRSTVKKSIVIYTIVEKLFKLEIQRFKQKSVIERVLSFRANYCKLLQFHNVRLL
jgi:hypothetical protein